MLNNLTFKELSKAHRECPVCEIERELSYGETTDVLKVRGEDIEVTSKLYYCSQGDHFFYSIEDEEEKFQTAYREYRKRKGLLQPEEIVAIRNQYGLSQKELALFLGLGAITIHRYETGAIQESAQNAMLMMIKDLDDFKKFFTSRKNYLDQELAVKIEKKIATIERERMISLIYVFPVNRKNYDPIVSNFVLDYSSQVINSQCCDDNELALAA